MPHGRIVRRARRGGVVAAVANGVGIAYRNRHAIRRVAGAARAGVQRIGAGIKQLAGRKRRRSGQQQRVGMSTDNGAGGELSVMKISVGKSHKQKLPAVVRASIQPSYIRWQSVNPGGFDNVASATTFPGAQPLDNSGASGGPVDLPMYLLDVTMMPNNNSPPLYPMFRARISTTGVISWIEQGKTGNALSYEEVGNTPNAGRGDFLEWANIKMLMYGAVKRPTKFQIDVINIKRDYCHPDVSVITTQTGDAFQEQERNALWQAVIRPDLVNPILSQGLTTISRGIKFLKKTEFVLQEKLTNEQNTAFTGHMKQVTLDLQLNRVQRYDWQNSLVNTNVVIQGVYNAVNIVNNAALVAPAKRVYVMIRATAPYNNTAVVDPTQSPSFDIVYRAKHTFVN